MRIRSKLAALISSIAALGATGVGDSAVGQDSPSDENALVVPCDGMPAEAATSIPGPFTPYMELVCTRSGQALKPVAGYQWVFDAGPMWLAATNPASPSRTDHYTELTLDPLEQAQVEGLRAELRKITSRQAILEMEMIRLSVETSWGAHKQIYLLLPPAGAPPDERVLGMECVDNCLPIDEDPWFFTIAPIS
jgi:hypothetical protein